MRRVWTLLIVLGVSATALAAEPPLRAGRSGSSKLDYWELEVLRLTLDEFERNPATHWTRDDLATLRDALQVPDATIRKRAASLLKGRVLMLPAVPVPNRRLPVAAVKPFAPRSVLRAVLHELARKRFEEIAPTHKWTNEDLDVLRAALRASDDRIRGRAVQLALKITLRGKADFSRELFALLAAKGGELPRGSVPVIGKLGRSRDEVELMFLTLWPQQSATVRRAMMARYDDLETQELLGRQRGGDVLQRRDNSVSLRVPLLPGPVLGLNESPYFQELGTPPKRPLVVFDDRFADAVLHWWVWDLTPAQQTAFRKSAAAVFGKALSDAKTAKDKLKLLYWRDRSLFPGFPPDIRNRTRETYIRAVMERAGVLELVTEVTFDEPPIQLDNVTPPLSNSSLLKHLRPLLNHRDRGVRGVARMMLATRDDDDLFLFTRLSGALQDGEADAAGIAALFDQIRSRHKLARSMLPRFYRHPDPKLRLEAIAVISRLSLTDRDAQRLLLRSLKSDDARFRTAAAAAMLHTRLSKRLVSDDLRPLLDGKDPAQIAVGCRALGTLGKPAAGATQRLTELLKHDDERVRLQAAGALFRIHGPDAKLVPVLAKLLKSRDANRRLGALSVLRCYGPQARPAAASLLEAMSDPDERVAHKALGLLKIIQAAETSRAKR